MYSPENAQILRRLKPPQDDSGFEFGNCFQPLECQPLTNSFPSTLDLPPAILRLSSRPLTFHSDALLQRYAFAAAR
jgi:hypothetical protein